MLCIKFGQNWPRGFREEVEHVKGLQTDRQTDEQMDNGNQKSLLEPSVQVS